MDYPEHTLDEAATISEHAAKMSNSGKDIEAIRKSCAKFFGVRTAQRYSAYIEAASEGIALSATSTDEHTSGGKILFGSTKTSPGQCVCIDWEGFEEQPRVKLRRALRSQGMRSTLQM